MRGIDVAKQYLGLQENRDVKKLIAFFKEEEMPALNPATTPWCAEFIGACERKAGNKGTGKLNARSYLDYGTPVNIEDAQEGDILIFSRGNNNWEGHVTYFVKIIDGDYVQCLGGNQQDMVCY